MHLPHSHYPGYLGSVFQVLAQECSGLMYLPRREKQANTSGSLQLWIVLALHVSSA